MALTSTVVRTNYELNPEFVNNTGWSTGTGITWGTSGVATWTSWAGSAACYESAVIPANPGDVWSASRQITVPAGAPTLTLRLAIVFYNTQVINYGAWVTVSAGQTVTLTVNGAVCPAGQTGLRTIIYHNGAAPANGSMINGQALAEKASLAGTWFDGNSTSGTYTNGIITYAWTAAANSSSSTMSELAYYTSNFNGLTFGPGTDIQLVEIDGLRSMKTRTSDVSYPEDDGALPGIDLLAERTITYKLMVAAPQTMSVEQALEACAAAFQVIRDPAGGLPLEVFLPGWTEPRQLTARPVNNDVPIDVNYSLNYLQFAVQFDCADPLIYSTTQHTASTGLPSPSAGLPFNVTFPAAFGASSGGSVQVTNAGNYASRPVVTIKGPCINPRVDNGTDFMQFNITLASTDVLVIDMAAKSVTLNGSASRYNTVATGSAWWALAPGVTTMSFSTSDGAQVAATATIQWRDAWGMM